MNDQHANNQIYLLKAIMHFLECKNGQYADKQINKIAIKTMREIVEIINKYSRKFDQDVALLERYNIRGLYNFTEHSAKMEEDIKEETTEMTEELMAILRKIPVKSE